MPGGTAARADAIELADVTKAFGGLTALAGVSLSLPHRSRTGIVGPSGGGKTTLLQIVAGLLEADTAWSGSGTPSRRGSGSRAAR